MTTPFDNTTHSITIQNQLTNKWQIHAVGVLFVSLFVLLVIFLPTVATAKSAQAQSQSQRQSHVVAQQCFADIHTAYAHVISQEQLQHDALYRPMVNINRADEATLTTLDGIGSSKAQAIILYREMFGGFASVDELAKVKGIGQKTVDNNRDRLKVVD